MTDHKCFKAPATRETVEEWFDSSKAEILIYCHDTARNEDMMLELDDDLTPDDVLDHPVTKSPLRIIRFFYTNRPFDEQWQS